MINHPQNAAYLLGQQRGFSMLEVLITMLVVSIGLLGIASLQLKSLQYTHMSLQRSIVTSQANDLAERLWANVCDLPDNTLRDTIRTAWQTEHGNSFSAWTGGLTGPDANDVYTITIQWTDARAADNTVTTFEHYLMLPELECGA